jgi:hypothetical protein
MTATRFLEMTLMSGIGMSRNFFSRRCNLSPAANVIMVENEFSGVVAVSDALKR